MFFIYVTVNVFCFIFKVEEGWWEGILNGKTGMFPSNFIKELPEEPEEAVNSQEDTTSKASMFRKKERMQQRFTRLFCWFAGFVIQRRIHFLQTFILCSLELYNGRKKSSDQSLLLPSMIR